MALVTVPGVGCVLPSLESDWRPDNTEAALGAQWPGVLVRWGHSGPVLCWRVGRFLVSGDQCPGDHRHVCIWVVCCTRFPSNQMEKPLPQGSQSSTARGGFSRCEESGALMDVSLLVHEREPRRLWPGNEGAEPGLYWRIRFSRTFVFSISLYPASELKNIQWSDTFGKS